MNDLIKNTVQHLNIITRFEKTGVSLLAEETLYEAAPEDDIPDHMHRNIHDFMFHLSGPSDPTGTDSGPINEATLFDIKRGDKPGAKIAAPIAPPSAEAHINMRMPKSAKMIAVAHEKGMGHNENLHKKIGAEFRNAFDEMTSEKPEVTTSKRKDAQKAFQAFAQSRGLKAKTPPKMLRGNMKTEKSTGEGVLTTGLNLAPHATAGLHGFDVCPKSSIDCRKNCLGTEAGGNRQYPDTAMSSKILRTHFIAAHPEHAARLIDHEITQHKTTAKKKGMLPGIRMNITSDISWEHHAPKMFERHKDVQFYDYTKMHNRVLRSLAPKKEDNHFNEMGHPSNYHLSLSHTGTGHGESNDKEASQVLKKGGVVAMVFQKQKGKKNDSLPTHIVDHSTGRHYPVHNGDLDDNTFDRHASAGLKEGNPHQGVISGLMLKGVKNEAAGSFANPVLDGVSHINKPDAVIKEATNATSAFYRKVDAKRLG